MLTLTAQYIEPYYTVKRALVESVFAESMPEAIKWRLQSGERGMFCWQRVNHERFDDLTFNETLKRNGVFIVPGRHFFPQPLATPFLRTYAARCFWISLSPDEAEATEQVRRPSIILAGLAPDSRGANG